MNKVTFFDLPWTSHDQGQGAEFCGRSMRSRYGAGVQGESCPIGLFPVQLAHTNRDPSGVGRGVVRSRVLVGGRRQEEDRAGQRPMSSL